MIYIPSGAALKCQRHSDVDATELPAKLKMLLSGPLYKSLPPAGLQDEVQTPHQAFQLLCDITPPPPPSLRSHSLHKRSPAAHLVGSSTSNEEQFHTSPLSVTCCSFYPPHHTNTSSSFQTQFMFRPTREMLSDNQTSPTPTALNSFVSQLSVYSSDSQTSLPAPPGGLMRPPSGWSLPCRVADGAPSRMRHSNKLQG